MTHLVNVLSTAGMMILNVVIVVGALFAFGKIALGHRDGWGHLIALAFVILLVGLWESGQLVADIHELLSPPVHAAPAGPGLPVGVML